MTRDSAAKLIRCYGYGGDGYGGYGLLRLSQTTQLRHRANCAISPDSAARSAAQSGAAATDLAVPW